MAEIRVLDDTDRAGPQDVCRSPRSIDVLLIEDDLELASQTLAALTSVGLDTRHADTIEAAKHEIETATPDILVIDRMLPDGDGLAYLNTLKSAGFDNPSLILSALGETAERVRGLNNGADDYLAKPFDFDELRARVTALLRRSASRADRNRLALGDLELDLLARTASRAGEHLDLQPREFALLTFFAEHAGDIVTKEMLLKNVWNLNFDPQTNVVEVHVSRLRTKIDRGRERKLLHTIRGKGYCLRA